MKRTLAASDARWRKLWDEHDRKIAALDRRMEELNRQEAAHHGDFFRKAAIWNKQAAVTKKMIEVGMKFLDRTKKETDFKLNALIEAQMRNEEKVARNDEARKTEMAELRQLMSAWLRGRGNGHSTT